MTELVDFSKFNSLEEALKIWLEPSLVIKIGINMPPASNPPPICQQPPPHLPLIPRPELPPPPAKRLAPRARSNPNQGPGEGKNETIDPPFQWATDRRATVHTLDYLVAHGLTVIKGEVQCRRCERREVVAYDLLAKLEEVKGYVRARLGTMFERAPAEWMYPVFGECGACLQHNCMRPVLPQEKRNYNWLFLFLGQSLGICTLNQIKWFCKHTGNHRTGAKDRVLYLTYITIGKQLYPTGIFQRLWEISLASNRRNVVDG